MFAIKPQVESGDCVGPNVVRFADPARSTIGEELHHVVSRVRQSFGHTTDVPVTHVRCGPTVPSREGRAVVSSVELQVDGSGRTSYTHFKIERRRWLVWEELNGGWLSRREGVQECRSEMLPGSSLYRAVIDAYIVFEDGDGPDESGAHARKARPAWRSHGKVTHHYRYVSSPVSLSRPDHERSMMTSVSSS